MEFLNSIRLISIPKWLLYSILFISASLLIISIFIVAESIPNVSDADILTASTGFLATIFPIFALILVFIFSNSGLASLEKKTDKILMEHIPKYLRQVPDKLDSLSITDTETVYVTTNHHLGLCYADYKISFFADNDGLIKEVQLLIRLELNVRKVNFNLYFDLDKIERKLGYTFDGNNPEHHKEVIRHFVHSTDGASQQVSEKQIVYKFNPNLLNRMFDGKQYYCLVGSAMLNDDFLWDASEVLFFSQDLMFMLRSFYTENLEFFTE